jgi:hypothetical protein
MTMAFLRAVGLGAGHPDSFPHVILQVKLMGFILWSFFLVKIKLMGF